MPRARIDLGAGWREKLAGSMEPKIAEAIMKEPLTEPEIFAAACSALGAGQSPKEIAASIRRMYSLRFRRSVSESTAMVSVLSQLKRVVSSVKERLLLKDGGRSRYGTEIRAVGREIRFGRDYYGRIFYRAGDEERLQEKAKAIVMAHPDSTAAGILSALQTRGYVFSSELKSQKRAIDLASDLLLSYGLIGRGMHDGKELFHVPGFSSQTIDLVAPEAGGGPVAAGFSEFFGKKGFKVWKNFRCGIWTLAAEGPKVVRMGFGAVAFDPESFQLHIADSNRKKTDISKLRALRRKARDWGLPAVLHFFAPSFTPTAEKYAAKWGIRMHSTGSPNFF